MDIWKIEEKNFKDREKTARKYTKNREANYRGHSNHSTYTTPRVDNYYKLRCMYIIAHVLFYWLWSYYLTQLHILFYIHVPYFAVPICPLLYCTQMSQFLFVPVSICSGTHMCYYPYFQYLNDLVTINPSTDIFLYAYDPQPSFLVPPAPPLTDYTLIKEKL